MKTKKSNCVVKASFNVKVTGYNESMNLAMSFREFCRDYKIKKSEYRVEVKKQ